MTLKADMIEAAKRRLGFDNTFSPEHSGLSDDGRVLSIHEAMPGGGMVVDKRSLEAQSDAEEQEIPIFSLERAVIEAQREAVRQTQEDAQKAADRAAKKHPDDGQQDSDSGNKV